jgi:hypothetical protein
MKETLATNNIRESISFGLRKRAGNEQCLLATAIVVVS